MRAIPFYLQRCLVYLGQTFTDLLFCLVVTCPPSSVTTRVCSEVQDSLVNLTGTSPLTSPGPCFREDGGSIKVMHETTTGLLPS